MSVFADADEVYRFVGGIFEQALVDPVMGRRLAASGVVLKVHHTEPGATFTVDMPHYRVVYGDDGPAPVIEMFMSADLAHRLWLGRVNVSSAIARRQVRTRGSITKIFRLVPLVKDLFPTYRHLLEEAGRQDLLAVA
jgi:hypothetical protein